MSSRQRSTGSRQWVVVERRGLRVLGLACLLVPTPSFVLLLLLALTLGSTGCQSGPVRAFQGARYYAAGSDALEAGDSERAIDELRRAAERVPHASEIQNHLGLAYLSKGETEPARAAFELALELDCDNQAARWNLVRLERRAGVGPEAPSTTAERAHERPATRPADGRRGQRDGG